MQATDQRLPSWAEGRRERNQQSWPRIQIKQHESFILQWVLLYHILQPINPILLTIMILIIIIIIISMEWIDLKKAYDSVDHGWLNGAMLHRFPTQMCRFIAKLCRSWNTRVLVVTRKWREKSKPIRFCKGLPQGDALCPRLFTVRFKPSSLEGKC